jgi:RNase P subunit RPR2
VKTICDTCLESFIYDKDDVVRISNEHVLICPHCGSEVHLPEDDGDYDDDLELNDPLIKLEELEEEDEYISKDRSRR